MNIILPGEAPKQEVKKEVVKTNWYAEKALEKEDLLSNMVSEWNSILIPYNRLMFDFCTKLSELRKQFEHDSFATIIREFSNHPEIRHPPSPGRIWQYLKLMENKPKILNAIEFPERKENKDEYYYKKDGSLFTEFYIELYGGRHSLPDDVAKVLEKRGRKEKWSYRQLIDKIHEATEDSELMTGNAKLEKAALLRKIIGKLKSLSVDQLKELYIKMQNA